MAGGHGTRFWPLSRSRRPKQLLRILSRKSLIQETADRIAPLFKPQNTLVVTLADHYRGIRQDLKTLPRKNFLIEPEGKNTAPCIGLAALELLARNPDAIMTVLPADHWISDVQSFRRTLKTAIRLVQTHDALVTIGIPPGYPETGYGYIVRGDKFTDFSVGSAYRVKAFHEKPSVARAQRWIRSGALWNSGIFVWRAATILALLGRFCPSLFHALQRISREAQARSLGFGDKEIQAVVRKEYRKLPAMSIDHGVLEGAAPEGRVLMLEADFDWSDVGTWAAVHRLLPQDNKGNAAVGRWLGLESEDCFVYSPKRLVALLGIREAVIVDTPDALFVGDIKQAQRVRELVEKLKKSGYGRLTTK
ncbi:MAG: mannose-1-phosphate guanylyltransferase [Candidatus Binatia bacterium]